MRTIKIKTNFAALPFTVETSAHTFGELKNDPAVKSIGIDWNTNKLLSKDSRVSIELDESILPQDVYFFVFPTATKSGAEYSQMKFGELRKLCATTLPKGTLSANPTKDQMVAALEAVTIQVVDKSVTPSAQQVSDVLTPAITVDSLDAEYNEVYEALTEKDFSSDEEEDEEDED